MMAGGSRVPNWDKNPSGGWVLCISATSFSVLRRVREPKKNRERKIHALAIARAMAWVQVAPNQGLWPGCVFP